MKNLVIGSEGFIGKIFCNFLLSKGEEVVRFDIKNGAAEDARVATLPLSEVDRVYFLAWDVGGAKYLYKEDAQLGQLDWNVSLMQNVMNQLQEHKNHFFSSLRNLQKNTTLCTGSQKDWVRFGQNF